MVGKNSTTNLFSLLGKTAVLTGATGYLGTYFARALLDSGARVFLVGRNEKKLESLVKKFSRRYGSRRIASVCVDLYDNQAARNEMEKILRTEKKIDILINNAFDFSKKTGFNDEKGKLGDATHDQFLASFEAGVYWAVQPTQVFGYAMKKRGTGSIVNISTMYAVVVPAPDLYEGTTVFNPPGYSMAKAGLLQFTKYCASFLSPEVRVNALSPGAIPNVETVTANAVTKDNPVLDRLVKKTPLRRVGHPSDLLGALVFLASDASCFVTGQNIVVDGGLTII